MISCFEITETRSEATTAAMVFVSKQEDDHIVCFFFLPLKTFIVQNLKIQLTRTIWKWIFDYLGRSLPFLTIKTLTFMGKNWRGFG